VNSLLSKKNVLIFLGGIALLVIGFLLLGRKPADNPVALNVAPFVLLLAYLVVIPASLWLGRNDGESK
jgi:uncharacterized membrane protein